MRLLSRFALLPLVLFAAACASSGQGAGSTTRARETVRIQGVGTLNMSGSSTTTAASTLSTPVDQAWSVLPAVYDSLGIAITTLEPASHTIGNSGLKIRRRLGATALSKYLDCGNTQMGPSADNYEIYLTVTTQLSPSTSGDTKVESTIDATARSVQFAQSPSHCSSTGELEKRISMLTGVLAAHAKH